ncbi:prenyltransferase alpha subunit repeat protein [Syncephalastrum racemosum]|uniref:Protein farnesyltransferase/geranylgeranyltransferase type-1 subunit alpha n=1 Tax=Syncephalastrum racemosum TaxID=13706 RepID=A0A1X2HXX9_SYNRA|nr:prenyltransferase alpha subunit repeat protein [Syncephalastrum racemosum]
MSYADREDWKDVQPIPQDDGPNPLVPIAYGNDYREAMDYFRAVMRTEEKSKRVLELTADIIDMNPAHYTVWQYRQDTLFAINADLRAELEYINEIASEQAKSYQIWHHRQVVVDKLGDGSGELAFINAIIDEDSKNYHAWSYRQWVVTRFDYWDKELLYTDDLLVFDVRNNSAWNHRHFVLFNRPGKASATDIQNEITFAKNKIALAPNNQSGWTYLHAMLEASEEPFSQIEPFLRELQEKGVTSPHLWSMYIDVYENEAKSGRKPINPAAVEYCGELATRWDPIREKYWHYRRTQLEQLAH